ncbi:MAG: hypothetical protein ABWZ98_16390 [Nakamurella sp.]
MTTSALVLGAAIFVSGAIVLARMVSRPSRPPARRYQGSDGDDGSGDSGNDHSWGGHSDHGGAGSHDGGGGDSSDGGGGGDSSSD